MDILINQSTAFDVLLYHFKTLRYKKTNKNDGEKELDREGVCR